jgi:hypothetical protein
MARLIVREGETTRMFELGEEQVGLGRATDNDITLEDSKSSRNHAALRRTATGYELIDLESRNGTRVNGEPVKQRLLEDGDVIQIGQATITYTLQEPAETEAVPAADTDGDDDDQIVEGLEVASGPSSARRRMGRGRRFSRRERTPIMLHSPGAPRPTEPVKPQAPVVLPDPKRNAETHEIESPEQLEPDQTPVEVEETPPPREPPPPGPVTKAALPTEERSSTMRKFHLLDQGRVRTFARLAADQATAPPIESLFADAGELVPWEEVFKTEGRAADRAGAALLLELRDAETQKGSLLLVDSAGVATVVEDGADAGADAKAHRALIGKGINLAALLATEWTAETLKKEFEAYSRKVGREPAGVLQAAFGKVPSPDFWKGVEQNLQAGGIRVIFLVREATVAIQKVIDFLFGSTNMTAYALQLEAFQELKAEKPRSAFTVKLYGPSKSARHNRTAKAPAAEESRAASPSALDVVSM